MPWDVTALHSANNSCFYSPKTQNFTHSVPRIASKHDGIYFGKAITLIPITRLVIDGKPTPQSAEQSLLLALKQWPKGTRSTFLMTPGGFLTVQAATNVFRKTGWESQPVDLARAKNLAEEAIKTTLTQEFYRAAQSKIRYLTLGVDVVTDTTFKTPHAELVAVVDIQQRKIVHWTGKSYPHSKQEHTLVHETNLNSHLFTTDTQDKVLILGCHDLNLFSPRAFHNQSPGSMRRRRTEAMETTVAPHPDIRFILQHPHGTDTPNIWRGAWSAIQRKFPHLTAWASAVGYFNFNGGKPRQPLARVLTQTRDSAQHVQDIVVKLP